MKLEIEEVKTKNNKKIIIAITFVFLLIIIISIGLGILAVKLCNLNKEDNQQIQEESQKEIVKTEQNQNKKEIQVEQFILAVNNIYNAQEGKRVFLTFDDGPSASVTPYILDILKKNKIKATFFVLGNRVSDNAEILKREYNEGHYIACHGYSHQYNKIYASSSKVLEEYNKTEKLIKIALGKPDYECNLFRFPGGSIGGIYEKVKQKSKKELAKEKIAYLDWNALTNDADGANTKSKIMKNLKETVKGKNNVVLLMHDAPDKQLTYKTLGDVIKYLKKEGYAFKNMYDLMKTEE